MTVRALCVIKNEADVIEHSLMAAGNWCDEIHVLDNGSEDGSWERVLELASSHPQIIPFGRDIRPFQNSIRAQVYRAVAPAARPGDWWCRLDADEFYVDDPRQFLAKIPVDSFSVWSTSLSYYFTDLDEARFAEDPGAFADDVPPGEKCRFYLNHWSEPRFFRHDPGVRWTDRHGGYPAALWSRPPASDRILLKHFAYRSPAQIQRRLDDRRQSVDFSHEAVTGWAGAVERIRSGGGGFTGSPAASGTAPATWRDRIVAASALDYDAHDGQYVINRSLMPPLPTPVGPAARWRARARGIVGRIRSVPSLGS
ncbi:MAG: glycosyltransferase family 2 protein [Microbacteriaceae bacterium]|nr:glycosyltransferase family 2 protein [Microbacteriaceae bacterium]